MSVFFRLLQHLLPTGRAWRLVFGKQIRKFFEGLATPFQGVRDHIDQIWLDIFPQTTRQLSQWETQFGLLAGATEEDRRAALTGAWQAQGGQSPSYLQTTLQAAGFDVFVHEWWVPGSDPRVARDPRDYTNAPTFGTWQCTDSSLPSDQPQCTGREFRGSRQPQCNRFLANEPMYLVNKRLSEDAPPPIPNDSTKFPFFLYVGGETFPDLAVVDSARRQEFERLVLRLRPTNAWVVTLIDYV
jgi:hypothetical protein